MLAIISASTGAIAPRSADTIARSISVSVIGSKLFVATDFATSQEYFSWVKEILYHTNVQKSIDECKIFVTLFCYVREFFSKRTFGGGLR